MSVYTLPPETRFSDDYELRSDVDGKYLTAQVTTYEDWKDVGPFHERMSRGVFDTTLTRNPNGVKLIVHHDTRALAVGTPVDGGWVDDPAADVLLGTWRFGSHDEALAAHRAADEGMFGGVSVGFLPGKNPGDNEWSADRSRVTRHHARLLEVSLVTVPANEDARIVAVRTLGPPPTQQQIAPELARWRAKYPRRVHGY